MLKDRLIQFLVYWFYVLLLHTVRLEIVGQDLLEDELEDGMSPVVACPHTVLLPCLLAADGMKAAFLVSRSRDGEFVSQILERRGFRIIRGSSSRGGVASLLQLFSQLKGQAGVPIGIAFDGPRGPALVPKGGVAACARRATGSTFLVAAFPVRSRLFGNPLSFRVRSWDRFLVLLPFARVQIVFERVLGPASEEERALGGVWEKTLLELIEARARALYGYIYQARSTKAFK